jgi:hypothetical protein
MLIWNMLGVHFPGFEEARFRLVSPRDVAVEADSTALVNLLGPVVAFAGSCGRGVVEEPGVEPGNEFFCRLWDIVPELVVGLIFMGSFSEAPNAPGMTMGAELGAGTPPAVYGIPPGIGVVLGLLLFWR